MTTSGYNPGLYPKAIRIEIEFEEMTQVIELTADDKGLIKPRAEIEMGREPEEVPLDGSQPPWRQFLPGKEIRIAMKASAGNVTYRQLTPEKEEER